VPSHLDERRALLGAVHVQRIDVIARLASHLHVHAHLVRPEVLLPTAYPPMAIAEAQQQFAGRAFHRRRLFDRLRQRRRRHGRQRFIKLSYCS